MSSSSARLLGGGARSNSTVPSAPAERRTDSDSSSPGSANEGGRGSGGGQWRNSHNRQQGGGRGRGQGQGRGQGRGRGRGRGGGRGRDNNDRYGNNRERGQNYRRYDQEGDRGSNNNRRHQQHRRDGYIQSKNDQYGQQQGGPDRRRRQHHTPRETSSSSDSGGGNSSSSTTAKLRERLNAFRAQSSAVRQEQAKDAKGGRAQSSGGDSSNPTTTSSRNVRDRSTTTRSTTAPAPSSNSDSGPGAGRSKISDLRDALMGSLKRSQADKTQSGRGGGGGRGVGENNNYGAQYKQQQNLSDRRPSWRDRAKVREQMKGGIDGAYTTFDDKPRELESDKILREIEEAKLKAIQAVQESGIVEAASEAEAGGEEEDASNTIVLPHRSLRLSELSSILRVRTSKLIETVSSLGERVPQDDADAAEYKIDIDVAELAALELGFDPVRAKRGAGHKWKSLEDAERRMRRGVSGSAESENAIDEVAKSAEDIEYESLPPRPPVVCIMGHVDHGKTTLMDALRRRAEESTSAAGGKKRKVKGASKKKKAKNKSDTNTKKGKGGVIVGDVAGTEAGGITQVVTAFQLLLPSTDDSAGSDMDAAVTFLDTPGHAAFKSMRRSGSSGADIIVLVVAADDGVSPQTIEIIDTYKSIAKAQPGSISLVVAMTKIDKPGVKIEERRMMIENQLLEQGILTEGIPSKDGPEFGPPAQLVSVSGMTGEGLDDLIEGLVLQSEVMDLRADEEARAEGVVMDARVDKGLGIVADCIVRWGKLERGDYVVSGVHGGKVRILSDVSGAPLQKAGPSQPVRIVGLKSLPKAGDPIISVQSEEIAKELVERREVLASSEGASAAFRADSTSGPELQVTGMASKQGSMLQKVLDKYGMGGEDTNETIRIPVVIKADADGSLEAVRDAMLAIGEDSKRDIVIDPICLGVGSPTTTDVTMAKESGASVFCFGLKGTSDKAAASLAEAEGVSIVSNDVIYTLLDEAKDLFAAHLPPVPVEKVHGSAEVKAVYDINNKKDAERIAGLEVSEGQLFLDKTISTGDGTALTCHYRILRNGDLVSDKSEMLRAKSLRHFKEEVTDVRRGDECGLGLGFEDIQEGDTIECYSVEMKSFFI